MGAELPKQYLTLNNQTMIESSISVLAQQEDIARVVVVLASDDVHWHQLDIANHQKIQTTTGGQTRADSVMCGLEFLKESAAPDDWVLVHDAARPFLTAAALDRLITALHAHPVGGLLAMPVVDTLKKVDSDHIVEKTLSRENIWAAQTPQMFRFGILYDAMQTALAAGVAITDESSAIEFVGKRPLLVLGDRCNIKITRPEDLE